MSADKVDTKPKTKQYRKPLPEIPLDEWVLERANKDCVKFYKSKASVSSQYPQLGSDGFFLLMMTKPQIDLLKKFCEHVVCIDKLKGDKFEIITLTIIDDLGHSFPCASVFTDEIDQSVIEVFVLEVKSIIGCVNVTLLMTGKDERISENWSQIIGQPNRKVCSTWEVLEDWKTNLCLITNEMKQLVVFKKLKMILKESVGDLFIQTLNSLLSELSIDLETVQFAVYFGGNYSQNVSTWAPCFVFEESKTNYQLEGMHLTFKNILKDKTTKRLDRALNNILELLRNKVFDRLLLINSNDRPNVYDLERKHNRSQKSSFKIVEKSSYWSVSDLKGRKEKHKIRYGDKDCKCSQKCRVCSICHHIYTCTCSDSNVRLNICRHIHGLCMHLAAGTVEYSTSDSDESDSETNDTDRPNIEESVVFRIGEEVDVACQSLYTVYTETVNFVEDYNPEETAETELDLESKKAELRSMFELVLNQASSNHQLQQIEKALHALENKLNGVKSKRPTKRAPAKGQISRQKKAKNQ